MADFRTIYRGNLWSGSESRSGPGSSRASTALLAAWLVDLVRELGIRSVLDAACGEGLWMPDLPGYVGVDIVPEAIETARAAHPSREYRVASVIDGPLPHAELIVTRDFMQHLSLDDGVRAAATLRAAGAEWLVASSYRDGDNSAGAESAWHAHRVNLEVSPFNFGPPERFVCDGYDELGILRDEPKIMGLWRL